MGVLVQGGNYTAETKKKKQTKMVDIIFVQKLTEV